MVVDSRPVADYKMLVVFGGVVRFAAAVVA